MAMVIADRVREQVAAPGTGAIACFGQAPSGYVPVADKFSTGDVGLFGARDSAGNWEQFLGTWNATTKQIARTATVNGTSGAGVAVDLQGEVDLWLTNPAADHALTLNIRAFGARGDGVTDDSVAIQAALDAVPAAGAIVEVPPGTYLVSRTMAVKANTTVRGEGTIKSRPLANWTTSTPYQLFRNENHAASSITDENIKFIGITIDRTGDTVGGDGTRHSIYLRKVRKISVQNVTVLNGSSCVALLGTDDSEEIGNTYKGFTNCGSDHWDSPTNVRVIGCHMETSSSAQMANFNPDATLATVVGDVADGFTFIGNTLVSTEDPATPCQFETLRPDGVTRNMTIIGNTFKNCYVVIRNEIYNVVVSGNTFEGFIGTSTDSAIVCYRNVGAGHPAAPSGVTIANNIVRDALTSVANVAVIRVQTDNAVVSGNQIFGTSHLGAAYSASTNTPTAFGNYAESGTMQVGRIKQSLVLPNTLNYYIGWEDTSGTIPRMFLQSDNNWIFQGTDSSGAARTLASVFMRSSASEWTFPIPVQLTSTIQFQPAVVAAAGTTIGTATVLADVFNEVTSSTAGVATGVALQAAVGAWQIVVNNTANTINVFPNNSGSSTIDGGAASAAVTIAAGKSKTFICLAAGRYWTIAAT